MRGFLAALMLMAVPAGAQNLNCANAMTQSEMNMCAERDWQAADAQLNAAYRDAMAVLKDWDADLSPQLKGGPDKLREAQRAWITFRDAACAAEGYPMRGGSAEPLLVYGCLARLTEQRAQDLRDLAAYGQ